MKRKKVVITDFGFKNIDQETKILEGAGYQVVAAKCTSPEEVLLMAADADALLVQWAPVNAEVISGLQNAKLIVRYGIGVDNVDLKAAKAKGIAVCNVPTYCINEVADHTMALGLSLARQLSATRSQLEGGWKITPPAPMPAFGKMNFVVLGFGRIAREVVARAKGFRFNLYAYDPYVSDGDMALLGVRKLNLEDAFTKADILSLHLPLTTETRHIVNGDSLRSMKKTAIVLNTSRGGLIDTVALAFALRSGIIAGAGLDVFEQEPLDMDHPLRSAPGAELTSHTAWYSEASVPALQKLAAEEVVRGLQGQVLLNKVN